LLLLRLLLLTGFDPSFSLLADRRSVLVSSHPWLTCRIIGIPVIIGPSFKPAGIRITITVSLLTGPLRSVGRLYHPVRIAVGQVIIISSFKPVIIIGADTAGSIIIPSCYVIIPGICISPETVIAIVVVPVKPLEIAGSNIGIIAAAHIRTKDTYFIIPERRTAGCSGLAESYRVDPSGISFRVITTGTGAEAIATTVAEIIRDDRRIIDDRYILPVGYAIIIDAGRRYISPGCETPEINRR
jgi:hypothetical protein